jgi:putative restriction endonuclease
MAFWWVNHKQTREQEVQGGYLWSPMRNKNGAFNQSYENLRHAHVGDIVFSYAHGRVGAVGRVTSTATASPKPIEFGNVGDYWSNEGWLVEVHFVEVGSPLYPKKHLEQLGPLRPERHSPFQANGNGNQSIYLAAISSSLGHLLLTLMNLDSLLQLPSPILVREPELSDSLLEDLSRIDSDDSLVETQRLQLAKARIGQGLFRKRVMLLDPTCRVTGVSDPRVLVASHIKPWKDSDNGERLSGFNGLLLSPHVDALFDDRLLSFEPDGTVLVHPSLDSDVLERWHIDPTLNVGRFRQEQMIFLEHHRKLFARKIA